MMEVFWSPASKAGIKGHQNIGKRSKRGRLWDGKVERQVSDFHDEQQLSLASLDSIKCHEFEMFMSRLGLEFTFEVPILRGSMDDCEKEV